MPLVSILHPQNFFVPRMREDVLGVDFQLPSLAVGSLWTQDEACTEDLHLVKASNFSHIKLCCAVCECCFCTFLFSFLLQTHDSRFIPRGLKACTALWTCSSLLQCNWLVCCKTVSWLVRVVMTTKHVMVTFPTGLFCTAWNGEWRSLPFLHTRCDKSCCTGNKRCARFRRLWMSRTSALESSEQTIFFKSKRERRNTGFIWFGKWSKLIERVPWGGYLRYWAKIPKREIWNSAIMVTNMVTKMRATIAANGSEDSHRSEDVPQLIFVRVGKR